MKKKSKLILGIIGIIIFIILFITTYSGGVNGNAVLKNFNGEVKFYKDESCGCCGAHASYLQKEGLNLEKIEIQDISEIKKQSGVPGELESCHTLVIGDYFVEGHIPAEAIEKLLNEKPDIAGIALPGMPEGSPGMPGVKRSEWTIYAVNKDGSYGEFMRI